MHPYVSFINPQGLARPDGYTHVAVAPADRLILVSGQVARAPDGRIVGKGDLAAQTRQVFENLSIALEAAGSSLAHAVKLTYFVRDLTEDASATIRQVRSRYLNADFPPASTLVGVAALAQPELLVEIECLALVPPQPSYE
ncbi:RidA family protein [uncultured Pigmentiphaga sp.]|jgi:Putative translation initiation inhibitor, yjgF family|uniref:RidA family protein n=1 Tax=uncultured Pigmentiphaga sp. TaxID=340361 RepID=UPI00261A5F99|nr:RidA family protein [uncultured Pigmentiphaga sp.]